MSFIYLASPYTHADPKVVDERADAAMKFTAVNLRYRQHIYSPIVHCHELAQRFDLPKDFEFWQRYNFAMLSKASELWVLTIDGWRESKGVSAEVMLAHQLSIPIIHKTYDL